MSTMVKILAVLLLLVAVGLGLWCYKRGAWPKFGGGDYDDEDDREGELDAWGALDASGAGEGIEGGGPFRLRVSDPEYTQLLEGKKTIEARRDVPPFAALAVGDPLVVIRARPKGDTSEYPGGKYKFDAEVARVDKYPNLAALLKGEGVGKVYPGKTAAEAAERFSVYLPPGASADSPMLALEIKSASGAARKPRAAAKARRL